ncbi:MAG: Transcriptional regulator NanR [Acidimicrobiales bacterium]|nr:MAG: FadR family transcriptional regulator [Actinomycetota bacterium]MBV6508418.1 Transcriptional regulator NanR [Acidimicrobiales bacterium]RIK04775.1 MAG: hypothetical protein DCC48_12035 [Acidobacteriota bacterium]
MAGVAFDAVARQDLGELVADQLRAAILRGEYAVGDVLPSEKALALQFDVNRTTLRDALNELEHLGMLDRRQGTRARVLDWRRSGSIALLQHLIEIDRQREHIDTEMLVTLVDVIKGFFGVTVDAVIDRHEPVGALQSRLQEMEAAARDGDASSVEAGIRHLWDALFDMTESVVLCLLWNTCVQILDSELDPERTILSAIAADIVENEGLLMSLQRLVETIRAHDKATARDTVDEVFSHVKGLILALNGEERLSAHHRGEIGEA